MPAAESSKSAPRTSCYFDRFLTQTISNVALPDASAHGARPHSRSQSRFASILPPWPARSDLPASKPPLEAYHLVHFILSRPLPIVLEFQGSPRRYNPDPTTLLLRSLSVDVQGFVWFFVIM